MIHPRCLVRAALLIGILASAPSRATAAAYFVNCTSGNDGAAGTSLATAWRTIGKAAMTVNSNDVVTVSGGPCVEGDIGFNRAALSGSGGCTTASDAGCTVFRGDPNQNGVSIRPPGSGMDGFRISGPTLGAGVDSIKFENFDFETNAGMVFAESLKVFNGGNTNLVFRKINVLGLHTGASVRLLNTNTTPATSSTFVLEQVKVVGTVGNGFVIDARNSGTISDVLFDRCFATGNKKLVNGEPACDGEIDGFSIAHRTPFTYLVFNIEYRGGSSENNGEDGYDVFDSFSHPNQAQQATTLLNVWARSNCSAGIRGSRSIHIENGYVASNGGPGIRIGAPFLLDPDSPTPATDPTVAKLRIVSSTF